jgi:hypothetical protein
MKKLLLFSAFVALCCAFTFINYKKTDAQLTQNKEVAPPSAHEDYEHQAEWDDYAAAYGKEDSTVKEATFALLLEQFPKGELPYNLTANVLRGRVETMAYLGYSHLRKEDRRVLPREFRKYFPNLDYGSRFSRMPPPVGEPTLAFEAKDKHVLIYFTMHGSYGTKNYYVATFSKKGKFIDERPFADVSLDRMTAATLDENLGLTRTSYSVLWDKQPDKDGYKNCKITELKQLKMTVESLLKEDNQKEIKLDANAVKRAEP